MLINHHHLSLKIGVLMFNVKHFIQPTSFENLKTVKEISPKKGTLFLENLLTIVLKHFFFKSSCSICLDDFDQELRLDAYETLRQKVNIIFLIQPNKCERPVLSQYRSIPQ